jgi:branched-subunit amino acid transport protein
LNIWVVLAAGGLATYLTRLSFIALAHCGTPPERVSRPLRFVPTAVLSALILPAVVTPQGSLEFGMAMPRVLAAAAAVVVAWRTRSVLLTLVVGMGVLWLATALLAP